MKRIAYIPLFVFAIGAVTPTFAQDSVRYKNASLSVEERTQDLLQRMTLEEKVGQLLCPLGWEMYDKVGDRVTQSEKFEKLIDEQHVGMFWAVYRADPWTRKSLETGLNPKLAAEVGNALQRYVMENTRLAIPLFLAEEASHGHMAIGTTVFPTGIGMAATWNPRLMEKISAAIAKEVRAQGGHIGYGPILDLSRDPRWSRVEEAYGEDPILTARMGAAYARGAGNGKISDPDALISTIKHFIAYGIPEGGHNGNSAIVSERELYENFLPPVKATIDAGALSVMTAYNSINGIPCTANRELLTDLLKKRWGFKGFVVSDLVSIDGLVGSHRVAKNLKEAGIMALQAGVDVDLGATPFSKLIEAVRNRELSESVVDSAVCNVLRLKFQMGLFENPYVDPHKAKTVVRNREHIALAREAARESVVLLENRNNTLPLSKQIARVAVIGPNADSRYNQLGDYTAPQEESNVKSVLDGIRAKLPHATVEYVKGCAIRDTTMLEIKQAVAVAKKADVAIVVVGGSSARDFKTKYFETGAAIATHDAVSDMESGEGFDRATLDLLGKQLQLLQAVKATGTPVVVIYIQGRPLNMNWAAENADALLTAWYPGQEGGNGIADVLWGDYNPAGRMPISVPRSVGQIPVYYNKKTPKGHNYVEVTADPLYTFGYGLSYTKFEYEQLEIEENELYEYEISVRIKNVGPYDGEEVVQLYLRDDYASVVQPLKQLKHFERVALKKGETREVRFTITHMDLSVVDREMKHVVEPGTFTVMVGASADDIRLTGTIEVYPEEAVLTDEFIYNSTDVAFPSVHAATIEETPAGLVTAFFGGLYEGHPEVSIYVSRQVDGKWTHPVKAVDGRMNKREQKACYNPVLYQVPGRELILFYKVGNSVQEWSGYLVRSFDNGASWSKPERLPTGFVGPTKNRPLLVGNRLICGSSTENNGWKVHFEYTTDFGKHWSKGKAVNDDSWAIIQPSILPHPNGTLQMVCRSKNEVVVSSFSTDEGKSWSEPMALDLPNNNSAIDAIALRNGLLMMVLNPVKATESAYKPSGRTPLCVAISMDGIYWRPILVLEDSPIKEYSYPSLIEGEDGMVHIVYTWRRECIKYVKIDPSQL